MNRVNLISLGVKDISKSLKFYKDIGFKTYERENNPVVAFFDNQGTKLELVPIKNLAKDINPKNPPEIATGGFRGITLTINLKSQQEVNAFMETVSVSGGVIVKQPEIVFWGGYSGYFQDPDGYYWEAAYGPAWKFDSNDMLIIEAKQ
jgi:predicted lactoylglutathione lyase